MLGVQRDPSFSCLGVESVIFLVQRTLPSRLRATIACPSLKFPVVKIFPPESETLAYPSPVPSAVQRSLGAFSLQSLSRPWSGEISSRFGPRHCGQLGSSEPDARLALSAPQLTRSAS